MIGSGLKKLAKENGMTVAHGVAYGSLQGFAATLSEGSGYKRIDFATTFTDPVKKAELMDLVSKTDVKKLYRVQNLGIGGRCVQVIFLDNPGTMKKIQSFLGWFIPLLQEYSATGAGICTECGCEVTNGRWLLVDGTAYYMHDSCAQKTLGDIDAEKTQRAEEDKGSYITGFVGALLGSALGAVLWAIVLNMGYVASLVGLVIGWLAQKGYDLFKGKQGKAKVWILILVIILGVLLGTIGAEAYSVAEMIGNGEAGYLTYGDIPAFLLAIFLEYADYRSAVMSNVFMGLLFAGLGVFGLLRKAGKEVAGTKVIELK